MAPRSLADREIDKALEVYGVRFIPLMVVIDRQGVADLPAPGTKRWVIRRKAEVVAAVRGGLLSLEEACSRYTLTVEEFLAWQYSIERHGLAGLRTTRIQQYRQ